MWWKNTILNGGWVEIYDGPHHGLVGGVVVTPHASSNDDKEKPAAPIAAPLNRSRRPSRNPGWVGEMFDSFMRITSNSITSWLSQGNRRGGQQQEITTRKPSRRPGTTPFYLLTTVNFPPFSHNPHPRHVERPQSSGLSTFA